MWETAPCSQSTATSLKEERFSFLAMNFFRCRTVACAEQRIHFLFRPRSLLLLHSRQMLTWGQRARSAGVQWSAGCCSEASLMALLKPRSWAFEIRSCFPFTLQFYSRHSDTLLKLLGVSLPSEVSLPILPLAQGTQVPL